MALRKVLMFVAAVGSLVVAFVAGSGSVAIATQGQAVNAGVSNSEDASTGLCNSASSCGESHSGGLEVRTDISSGTAISAIGGPSGQGVRASAHGSNSIGVNTDAGTYGVTAFASNSGSTGVLGRGFTYGVHGLTDDLSGGWGVWGEGNDRGVYGVSNNEGVVGFGNNVGVRADSPNIALRVTGKVELSRSGVATVAGSSTTPRSSVVVPSVALTAKSMVLVTMQQSVAGVWVRAAVPNVGGSSVTIYLNKAVSKSVSVAWMVIERP